MNFPNRWLSMFADLFTIRRVEESLDGVKRRTFYRILSWRLCVRSSGCYATWHDIRVKFRVDYGVFPKSNIDPYSCFITLCWHYIQFITLNGGKKTMLLTVYLAPETYSNLKALFTPLNVPGDLEYAYACDLKVNNMASGLTSHSSRHPCPYCTLGATQWDPDASYGQFRWIQSTRICGGLLPERRLRTNIFFNSLNPPLLNSKLAILLLCPPSPSSYQIGYCQTAYPPSVLHTPIFWKRSS